MTYLTKKEINFLDALKKDYEINGDKSYLSILFHGVFSAYADPNKELADLFQNYYGKLLKDSDLIMYSVGIRYIGKYLNTFWGTNSDGEVFGMGKEIQNIAFPIIYSYYGNPKDVDEKLDIIEYFKNHLDLNYEQYIKSYKDFCKLLGLEYKEDLDLISKQSEEFESQLENLI